MANLSKRLMHRFTGEGVPMQEEWEQFGADGEDVIYRLLREQFECVIRGPVIPHGSKYLEKDFLILHKGIVMVLEVKNWKGRISCDAATGEFCQDKENGVRKMQKSPVGTTKQYINCMKKFYRLKELPVGIVIFADPNCRLELPERMEGIRLVHARQMRSAIQTELRHAKAESPALLPAHILRCTRIYSHGNEFCKALIANEQLPSYDEDGREVLLSVEHLHYIRIEHQPLRLRDKLYVTFANGSTGVFYNHNATLSLCCLDGSCRQMALCKIQHILF